MPIRLLPPDVIDQIAAGEVVERPASVVKELVENAVDAGARHVFVRLEGGGIDLVEVTDDGGGIAPEELALALGRHQTSKLLAIDELAGISSYGFRGEALPSIASVSRLQIASRPPELSGGMLIEAEGGRLQAPTPIAMSHGTRVAVRDLFRQVPARRKFLLPPPAEARRVIGVLERMAMAAPQVAFSLSLDGQEALRTSGSGNLSEVFADLFGVEVAENLVPVDGRADAGRVHGLVSRPGRDRGNRQWQFLVIGGRPVETGRLRYAIEAAYQGRLLKGRFPVFCLRLEVPAGDVDVNVHPAKLEVRLRREREVASLLHDAVAAALSFQPRSVVAPSVATGAAPPPDTGGMALPSAAEVAAGREAPLFTLAEELERYGRAPGVERPPETLTEAPAALGQAGGLFLVAADRDAIYLFDQHAAHERIHYEQLELQDVRAAQMLLSPLVVRLSALESQTLGDHLEDLVRYGFEVEHFGDRDVLVRAVPRLFGREASPSLLPELLDALAQGGEGPIEREERVRRELAACRASVKEHDRLSPIEQQSLIRQLWNCREPRFCPHGRPTYLRLGYDELRQRFLRR